MRYYLLTVSISLLIPLGIWAGDKEEDAIAAIFRLERAPAGIVFEIVGGDNKTLRNAIQRSKDYMQRIKKKFPQSKFVVVSHGLEQFALTRDNINEYPLLHQQVHSLVNHNHVTLQVCGSLSEMTGHDINAFPDYVEVVDAVPLQIETYQEQGYHLIEMDLLK